MIMTDLTINFKTKGWTGGERNVRKKLTINHRLVLLYVLP